MEAGSLGSKSRAFSESAARARLVIAPLAMGLLDVVLTVIGQPGEYWAGGKAAALESNPLARLFLELHPLAFPIAAAVYLTLVGLLIVRSRREVAQALALVFTLGHAFGTSTWLLRLPWGIAYCVVLWVAARWLYGFGISSHEGTVVNRS